MQKKDFCFPFEEKLLPAAFTGNPWLQLRFPTPSFVSRTKNKLSKYYQLWGKTYKNSIREFKTKQDRSQKYSIASMLLLRSLRLEQFEKKNNSKPSTNQQILGQFFSHNFRLPFEFGSNQISHLFPGMPVAKFSEDKPLDFDETAIKKLDQVIGKPVQHQNARKETTFSKIETNS